MAKRAPKDEVRFNPLDESLVRTVVNRQAVPELPPEEKFSNQSESETRVVEEPVEPPIEMRGAGKGGGRKREKRVALEPEEERKLDRLVMRFAAELGTPVKLSHMLRSCVTLMLHAEEELIDRAKSASIERPGNGNAPELAQFQGAISELLSLAYREAPPYRTR